MRFTSATEKTDEYLAQCLFLGDVSLTYFAVMINVERNTLWQVQGIPI
jgi:hypothetical protein